ncbi:MAG: winged helix-turn-helix transcriptional regulator [Oscillibacter sp.]|nr:winged helix-turn-helix transcriptional regulator [Oscillibacter sp.]
MGVLNIITGTPGPHTPMMLAEALKISKPMITAHLTSLMNKGYITKRPSENAGEICRPGNAVLVGQED